MGVKGINTLLETPMLLSLQKGSKFCCCFGPPPHHLTTHCQTTRMIICTTTYDVSDI